MAEAAGESVTKAASRKKLAGLLKEVTHQTLKQDLKTTGKAEGKEEKPAPAIKPASVTVVQSDEIIATMARAGILPHDEMYALITALLKVAERLEGGTDSLNARVKATAAVESERIKEEVLEIEAGCIDRMTKVLDHTAKATARRVLLQTGAIVGGVSCLVVMLAGFVGYLVGESRGFENVTGIEQRIASAFKDGPEAAEIWLRLMDSNDPKAALKQCEGKFVKDQTGRIACYVPLWIDPPKRAP